MRHLPSVTNRMWLFILGLLLLLAGALATLIATTALTPLLSMVGLELNTPGPGDVVLGPGLADQLEQTPVIIGIIIGGVLLAVAGLAWLLKQIPRRGLARPFRLHDDPKTGLTRISADVLTDAVQRQLVDFHGVSRAGVQLRGRASEPELTIRVTTDERTDIKNLIGWIQHDVVTDLQHALDTTLARLAVQVEVDRDGSRVDQITR